MPRDSTERLVRSFHMELWGAGDISAIDRFVAPDATTEMTGFEGSSVEVLREDFERYVAAFDDVTTEILDVICRR